jgi:hypothetical protein
MVLGSAKFLLAGANAAALSLSRTTEFYYKDVGGVT